MASKQKDEVVVAEVIYDRVKSLPEARQREVLDFVEYQFYKSGRDDRLWMEMSLRSALRGFEDEVWPEYSVDDLREQWR